MRIIGVIDVKAGRAVHAKGGQRNAYEPLRSVLLPPDRAGDAAMVASAYRQLGLTEIYVADLDSIGGLPCCSKVLASIVAEGVPVMVDAGVTCVDHARAVLQGGARRVVVGLETLARFDALADIIDGVGGDRVVFSLDCRGPCPLSRPGVLEPGTSLVDVACRAVCAGAQSVLLLDLDRVGRAVGPDVALLSAVRSRVADRELLVGGGIRYAYDLQALTQLGCDGVLIGTALHGGLTARAT